MIDANAPVCPNCLRQATRIVNHVETEPGHVPVNGKEVVFQTIPACPDEPDRFPAGWSIGCGWCERHDESFEGHALYTPPATIASLRPDIADALLNQTTHLHITPTEIDLFGAAHIARQDNGTWIMTVNTDDGATRFLIGWIRKLEEKA